MNCLIDNVLSRYLKKGKRIDVIRRYMRLKYHINIDVESLKNRIRSNKMQYEIS